VATVEQLDSVHATMRPLVAAVGSDQWTAPTTCGDWDVRALLAHVVGGNRVFAAALGGAPLEQARRVLAGDPLGADPDAAYAEAAAAVAAALRAPGALERPVTIPFGTVPGAVALHLRIVEVLVHGWDLARATGRTISFPDDVVEQEIAFSREFLPRVPPGRTPFAASHPVPDDAAPLDRLVALLGRDPNERAPGDPPSGVGRARPSRRCGGRRGRRAGPGTARWSRRPRR
jgi:uncharacterized protein (TIGR03086 family)